MDRLFSRRNLERIAPLLIERMPIDYVVECILIIAENENIEEEDTRHLAIDCLIDVAEAREWEFPAEFVSRLFAVLMKKLLDFEEDEAAWHSDDDYYVFDESASYAFGLGCLDSLALAMGGNTLFPVVSEQLAAYLAAPEWRKRHAALVALAEISEGCSKVMIENSEQVVTMVLNSFQDPQPRVRWAAIDAIKLLSIYLGPHLQLQHHARVLPALASAMDDFENPRVQERAASAMIKFSQDCTLDIWTPYLDGIVSKLCVLLQSDTKMVQEGALTALESVAHKSSEEQFQKYYDEVMPCLKAVLVNKKTKADHMLRAKAMECICLVGMAVEKDKFRDDAKQTKKKRDSAELLSRVQRLTVERDAYKKQLAVERAEYADYRAECVSKLDEVRGSYSTLEDHCSQLEHELVEEKKVHKQKVEKIRRLEEGLKQAESRAAAAESRLESELKFMTKCQDAANEADDKVADVQVALEDIWKDTFTSWRI